jgi:hypothetical protein
MTHTHSDTFSCASNSHSHGMSHKHSNSFSCASGGSHTHDVCYKTSDLSLDANSNYSGYKLSVDHNYTNKLPSPTAGGHARLWTTSAGSHSHTISGSVSTYSGSTDSSSHSHTISGSVSQYSGSTGTVGSGNSHSHGNTGSALNSYTVLPPYITVYMWKRIS